MTACLCSLSNLSRRRQEELLRKGISKHGQSNFGAILDDPECSALSNRTVASLRYKWSALNGLTACRRRTAREQSEDESEDLTEEEESDLDDLRMKASAQSNDADVMFYFNNRESMFDVSECGQVPVKTLKELFETSFGLGEPKTLSLLKQLGETEDPYERKEKISSAIYEHFLQPSNRQITLYPIQPQHSLAPRKPSRKTPPPVRYQKQPSEAAASPPTVTPATAQDPEQTSSPVTPYKHAPSSAMAAAPLPYNPDIPLPSAPTTPVDLDEVDTPLGSARARRPRFGGYKCGKCGQLKRGHVCHL